MKSKILLRIASVVMFLHMFGHTFGHLNWNKSVDPARQEVIRQMTVNKFPFMGMMRSMSEYYEGFSLLASLALFLIAATLWVVSGFTVQSTFMVKRILVIVSLTLLAWGIDELVYFFPFAAAFSIIASALTAIAVFKLKKTE